MTNHTKLSRKCCHNSNLGLCHDIASKFDDFFSHYLPIKIRVMQDTALFQERTVQYLLHLDQSVLRHVDRASPLSMDYTPELLTKYMTLFCNAVRIQILVNSMPKALIIQLYTLVYNLDQVKPDSYPNSFKSSVRETKACCHHMAQPLYILRIEFTAILDPLVSETFVLASQHGLK